MPTLQQQKVACFEFCNELGAEWGGFCGDDNSVRKLPFWKRQAGAEFLGMKVEGFIVARYAAAVSRHNEFGGIITRCLERGVKLYILDVGGEELTGNAMVVGMGRVMAEKSTYVKETREEYDIFPGQHPPLGWKKLKRGTRHRLVPDYHVRSIALSAYGYFMEGFPTQTVSRKLRQAGNVRSASWCEDAFKAVVCGFPLETHRVTEAFTGFSLNAWRQRDPATLALLSRIADTFLQERVQLLESSALAQQLRPQLEASALAEPVPLRKMRSLQDRKL